MKHSCFPGRKRGLTQSVTLILLLVLSVVLASGTVLIYVDNPETVDIQDLGMVVEVIVYTSTLPYMTMDDVETP